MPPAGAPARRSARSTGALAADRMGEGLFRQLPVGSLVLQLLRRVDSDSPQQSASGGSKGGPQALPR